MVDPSVQFLHIPPPKTSGVPYGLNNYRFQSTFAEVAANLLKKQMYGFIYHRLSAVNYLGVILSRRHRLPLNVEYNGSEAWVAKNWGRAMSFSGLDVMAADAMLRHANLIVTLSDELRAELIER